LTYGIIVVTAAKGERLTASTITWISQASFKPPMVMMAVRKGGSFHDIIQESRGFVVHVVGRDQQDFAAAFFRAVHLEDGKLNGYTFEPSPRTTAPVFNIAPAWFEARIVNALQGGDHDVFLAEVISDTVRDTNAQILALSDTPWKYRR
jgi:flavin reductase (DIM6/NTAB) family NADH-FMN oxidoreductase RutF